MYKIRIETKKYIKEYLIKDLVKAFELYKSFTITSEIQVIELRRAKDDSVMLSSTSVVDLD